MASSTPSTPTSEKPPSSTPGKALLSPVSVNNATPPSGASASRFATAAAASSSSPMTASYSTTSSTHSRPSSPVKYTSSTSRTSSPSFNRRNPSSPSVSTAAGGNAVNGGNSASSSTHNPLHHRHLASSPTTPQRAHSSSLSRTGSRTPSYQQQQSSSSPTASAGSSRNNNPEAALSSLQELIRTMPSAASDSIPSPSARASPVTSTARLRSSSASGNGNPNSPAAASSAAPIQSQSSTISTLNPNAGGFQPGALSALGEVEHEVLITPQVATFAAAGLTSPGRHRQQSQHALPQSPHSLQQLQQQAQAAVAAGMQHAGVPFTSSNTGNNNPSSTGNPFGSPIQTPQSQIGNQHNPYSINMNTPEWQNFHNVFNKGIGVNNGGTPPSQTGSTTNNGGGNQSPMNASNPVDFASLLAGMNAANMQNSGGIVAGNQGGFIDYNNPNAIAAALSGMQMNNQNPMQAQLLMLQQMQLQQQAIQQQQQQQQNTTPQQQAALALQNQQLQLQALMSAQNTLQQQSQAVPQGVAPRFNQSNSQPDLAALAAGLAGNNNGAMQGGVGQNQFIAEQMALQAQYDQLRQQQQDLMSRFQEMQLHAAQLAQAQAQMSPQLHAAGSPVHHQQQQHQQQSQISSPLSGNAAHLHHTREASIAPSVASQGQQGHAQPPAAPSAGASGRPHRRGPSQSISGIGGIASSGPMGQFGSMGQFALPSSHSSSASVSIGAGGGAGGGLPKGHGRRHSVNVAANKRNENHNNINMAFSFPAGTNNPTQQHGQNQGQNAGNGMGGQHQQQNSDIMEDGSENTGVHGQARAARAYGHGRRESRGSIGSLAGWGSNSNVVTQSSVPITQPTVTDLAQAQTQLLQLSQFRASAGHSRIPSFGMQQLQSGPGGGNSQQQRKSLFAPYLPAASIPPLLQTGKLVIGILRVNKRNRSDAYVSTDVLDADVFICGSKDRNRALEGDVVAVELLDVDEVWGTKKEKEEKKRKKEESTSFDPKFQQALRVKDKKRDDVEVEGQGLTLFDDEQELNDDSKPVYAGHVIAVVERQAGQLFAGTLGILRPSSAATKEKQDAERRERDGIDIRGDEQRNRPKIVWFKPVDKRVPLVAIPADQAPSGFLDRPDDYVNTLFVACIKRWPITSLHPFGSLVEELGEIGNLEAESNALLKDCGFTDETFSDNVAKCLPPTPWAIPQTEIDARKDFRSCRVFTIDPDTARDLDDALHLNKLDDGTFEVGVHIADVSHFVKPNTALDREARRRGTTVYLVQRASPMLPEALSSDLCSLQPGEERLAFSSVFKMSKDGRVLSSWFGKSVIKSAAKLSYNMAQQAIDEDKLPEDLTIHDDHDMEGIVNDIKQLDAMAKEMRARRFENGALRIDNVKLSFALDEDGRPIDCVVYDRKDSHSLIEEFMLTANQAVAQKIASALPEQALLRRHEMPIARRLEGFGKRAGKLGFDFDITSAGALMKSFNALSKEDPELVLRLLATKAMLRASYICSGMFDIAKYHHYALNIPIYTHFTSPIRRYADVIVHRQLEAALSENPEGRFLMDPEAVSKVAQHCNTKKAAAKLAQESSQHLYLCTMISDLTQKYGPVMRQATVIGVLDQAFDVVVSEFGIEKRVHADQMPIENHVYDERSNTLQLYWKKGVDVIKFLAEHSGDPHLQRVKETAEQHARLMESSTQSSNAESALFEDDEAEDGEVPEVAPASKSAQQAKSTKKAAPVFEGVETTSGGHSIQTIKELQTVPVIVSSDLTVCPPVLKIFAVNPFN